MQHMGMESAKRLQRTLEEKAAKSSHIDPLSGEHMDIGAHERTASEIWQDEKEQPLFADFLKEKSTARAKSLLGNLVEKKALTPAQEDFLEESRKEFNTRRAETERLRTSFTVEHVRDIASTNKTISQMIGKIGAEAARDLLMDQVEKLAFSDEAKFKKITESMKQAHAIEHGARANSIDARVNAALTRMGITEKSYAGAVESSMGLAAGVTYQTEAQLRLLAKRHMGTLMTIADIFSLNAVSDSRAQQAIRAFEVQRDLLRSRNVHLADIATVLKATITPEMRLAMQKVMIEGGSMDKVPDTNVDTIAQMRSAKEDLSDDARKKRFADALRAESKKLKKAPRSFLPAEKDTFLDRFANSEDELQNKKKGRGVFATLLALIFKSKADIRTHAETLWP